MLIPKQNYTRDEKWREWLSTMPCMKCKIEGYSQAAHLEKGGTGIKGHDSTCAPLCCARPNEQGCHIKLDQHLEPHYWKEMLARMIETQRRAYKLWKAGDKDKAEELIRGF